MTLRLQITGLIFCTLSVTESLATERAGRANIIFFLVDDLGWADTVMKKTICNVIPKYNFAGRATDSCGARCTHCRVSTINAA